MGKWRWGVILDAGSSGTRIHIYRWLNYTRARSEAKDADDLARLPELLTKPNYTKKIQPGVSNYADNPLDIGSSHLQSLLDHALNIVPRNQVQYTPIFLMATAGMRLLEPVKQKALLDEICSYIKKESKFSLPDCDLHIQVIPGETEGLYGWLAANYLLRGFETPSKQQKYMTKHSTYGFLDMGGASAQIAFAPNSTETEKHANDLKLVRLRTLDGETSEYKVFTTTWLGFGVNQARERYIASLIGDSPTKDTHKLLDPCVPSGLKISTTGLPVSEIQQGTIILGTGSLDKCLHRTSPLLDKNARCTDQPCLLNGQHSPAIDWSVNQFVGVSEYWHTTHGFFGKLGQGRNYNSATYQKMVREFCNEKWEDIQAGILENRWGNNIDNKTAQQFCFKASWLINILHNGIGVPQYNIEDSDLGLDGVSKLESNDNNHGLITPFQAINDVGGMEVSWTLGKMLLYATGQIPPLNKNAPPVGFGPNLGDPKAFQIAGSSFYSSSEIGKDDLWSEAAEELAEKAQSRSTHGLLLFILILLLIGFFFRKRERRRRYNSVLII